MSNSPKARSSKSRVIKLVRYLRCQEWFKLRTTDNNDAKYCASFWCAKRCAWRAKKASRTLLSAKCRCCKQGQIKRYQKSSNNTKAKLNARLGSRLFSQTFLSRKSTFLSGFLSSCVEDKMSELKVYFPVRCVKKRQGEMHNQTVHFRSSFLTI